MVKNNLEFVTINVVGDTVEERHSCIDKEVDKMFDARIRDAEAKAIKGNAEALLLYNLMITTDKVNRRKVKQGFKDVLNAMSVEDAINA